METVLRVGMFVAASAGILMLSWRSLRAPRSHGFYRFFAFEALLALILLNSPRWFREPLSGRQIVSWLLLAASLGLAIEAFRLLHKIGRPARRETRGANLGFENTTTLVTVGAYRFIRHPMYASLLALTWGACLKHPSAPSAGLALAASGFLLATAITEERENLAQFGTAYADYMRTTRRFIPFLF
ncbi:MAG: isoprenylcysteine carboxylmethyltransferase family protein [Bryobacteraceae bacterium]